MPGMRRWSLLWWIPPVVLGLCSAAMPAMPQYLRPACSDGYKDCVSDFLILAAFVYVAMFGFVRIINAIAAAIIPSAPRRGFDIVIGTQRPDKMPVNPNPVSPEKSEISN